LCTSVGEKIGYGELAAAAAKLDVPKKEDLKLKPRSEWRYIGKDAKSYDLKDIVYRQSGLRAGYAHGRNAVRELWPARPFSAVL